MRSVVRAVSQAEMKVVIHHLEGVGHLQVLQRPASVVVLQVFGSVLQPDADGRDAIECW